MNFVRLCCANYAIRVGQLLRRMWCAEQRGLIMGLMTTTSLEEAARAYRRAEAALERRREELAAEIVAADQAGMRQVEIVKKTGYTRESVRRIVDNARKRLASD